MATAPHPRIYERDGDNTAHATMATLKDQVQMISLIVVLALIMAFLISTSATAVHFSGGAAPPVRSFGVAGIVISCLIVVAGIIVSMWYSGKVMPEWNSSHSGTAMIVVTCVAAGWLLIQSAFGVAVVPEATTESQNLHTFEAVSLGASCVLCVAGAGCIAGTLLLK